MCEFLFALIHLTKAYALYEPGGADLKKTFYTLYLLHTFAVSSHAEIIAITGKMMMR